MYSVHSVGSQIEGRKSQKSSACNIGKRKINICQILGFIVENSSTYLNKNNKKSKTTKCSVWSEISGWDNRLCPLQPCTSGRSGITQLAGHIWLLVFWPMAASTDCRWHFYNICVSIGCFFFSPHFEDIALCLAGLVNVNPHTLQLYVTIYFGVLDWPTLVLVLGVFSGYMLIC